ncbi:unnamed protein product [Moneuplotes crassus]|uniref:Uncharacterized protein n=1 Tax=Euplotes crassus TaxID=5936 RepID=A0AAD1Y3L3_EUPCR|nr:unnamed protein product [Moneuplotes crassus]
MSLLSLSQISSPDSLESTSKKNQRTSSDSDNVLKYTFKTKVLETTNRSLLMKIRQKQSVSKQIQQLNSELSPRFRLSKLDLEDIENSRVLRPGEWGAKLSVQLMRNIKKEERRKLYYKNRVRYLKRSNRKEKNKSVGF